MSERSPRGTKVKCQNEECAATFYDLNRNEVACPICGSEFDHEIHAREQKQLHEAPTGYARRKQPRILPIIAPDEPDSTAAETESDDDAEIDVETEESIDTEAGEPVADSADVLLEEDADENDRLSNSVPLAGADGAKQ